MHLRLLRIALLAIGILAIWPASPSRALDPSGAKNVDIGILAFRGKEHAVKQWKPTTDYLNKTVPRHTFHVVPLTLAEMSQWVGDGKVDFVLTNPGNYVTLESGFGVTRIVTLKPARPSGENNVFGAVIITNSKRDDIQNLADLKGKSFMAIKPKAFGGFQMAWRELKDAGVDPFSHFSVLKFVGFPQDQVAIAVANGQIDAGTVRSGVLENMFNEGLLDMRKIRVLNPLQTPGFPLQHSTRLYPEWPFAKLNHTSQELAQHVAIALLQMPEIDEATLYGNYSGWTVPHDYQSVHDLFRELRIGPYVELGEITFRDFIKQRWHWAAIMLAIILVSVAWAARVEHIVGQRTRELSTSNRELEQQISERRKAEKEARQRQTELAHVSRLSTMGEMATTLAHEINQPLSAISNYAQGCARRLRDGRGDSKELLEIMDKVNEQANRASNIIRSIRGLLRKGEPERSAIDLNKLIHDVIELIQPEAVVTDVTLRLDLEEALFNVTADPVQVQQVILNLIRNGMDSMSETPVSERVIMVRTRSHNGSNIEVSVSDRGQGVPVESLKNVFDPFFSTKADGLGMGLSISRTIIESHGGRLWAASEEQSGSTFHFTLPSDSGVISHHA